MSERVLVDFIKAEISQRFRTFGGEKSNPSNPVSIALADTPLVFAAGVDVEQVVLFVLSCKQLADGPITVQVNK